MLARFDPARHDEGVELLELQTEEKDDLIAMIVVPATVTYEQAVKTPWFYVVEELDA